MPLTAAAAKAIARIEAKILDKINDMKTNGGSFLQQSKQVTVAGQPVAIRQGGLGGALGKVGSALNAVTAIVQQAGDITALVQNPMALVESAVGGAISEVTGKINVLDVAGKLTGGQLSSIVSTVSNLNDKLAAFQAHTASLSGLASSIDDNIPDFKKITDLGNTIQQLGDTSVQDVVNSTASALKSQGLLSDIKDKMNIQIQSSMDRILQLDPVTDAAEISSILSDIDSELNNYATEIDSVVTSDTNNFVDYNSNLTATQDVLDLATEYNNPDSTSYAMLVSLGVAKQSTIQSLNSALTTAESEVNQEQQAADQP